jgi:hypothetical protein
MLKATMGKALLLASAIAGLALIAAPPPSKAASAGVCAGYARNIADRSVGHRGLVSGVLSAPVDVTGAVLTGRTTSDARWQHAYNRAYTNCRTGHVVLATSKTHALSAAPGVAIAPPQTETKPGCNFFAYNTWNPARC